MYTYPVERASWPVRLSRLWFALRTLSIRILFFLGKASFVEADVRMTTNNVADVFNGTGKSLGQKLLAHYQLETRTPLAGSRGWATFADRISKGGPHLSVSLECAFCGHHYFVQVLTVLDPLACEATGHRAVGHPASYSSNWFRFLHEHYEGEPSLACLRCEENSAPRVAFLAS